MSINVIPISEKHLRKIETCNSYPRYNLLGKVADIENSTVTNDIDFNG